MSHIDKPEDLIFTTLKSKQLDNEANDGSYDMLSTFIEINKEEIRLIDIVIYDENLVNRLDKLTSYYYGSNELLDLFLDYNDIINPFDIPLGRLIFVPEVDALRSNYKQSNVYQKMLRHSKNTVNTELFTDASDVFNDISGTTVKVPGISSGQQYSRMSERPKYNAKAVIF